MHSRSARLSSSAIKLLLILVLLICPASIPAVAAPGNSSGDPPPSDPSFMFIENAGQWDASARFQVWGAPMGTLWLAENSLWISVLDQSSTAPEAITDAEIDHPLAARGPHAARPAPTGGTNVHLSFPGANPHPRIEPYNRLSTKVSYFLGNDPAGWQAGVPVWGGVRYVDLYPGIDLEVSGGNGQLVPRLVARPGANLDAVTLRVEGADDVVLDGGQLRVTTPAGAVALPLLAANTIHAGQAPRLEADRRTFDVFLPFGHASTSTKALVQEPLAQYDNPAELLYSTFLGGSGGDSASGIALDERGRAYVVGTTNSSDFPMTPGSVDSPQADVFVARLSPLGSALEYATFLGGNWRDRGQDISVDVFGRAYVTGDTGSTDFPTTPGAFDTGFNGGEGDTFVVRLNEAGSALEYATLLGGRYPSVLT